MRGRRWPALVATFVLGVSACGGEVTMLFVRPPTPGYVIGVG